MKELIPIGQRDIGNGFLQRTVNARDLHAFLEVKQDFSNWIKAQIERAGLEEGIDYIKLAEISEPSGQTIIEYFLAIPAGKHVAMMSRTEKGKQVRNYFIEVEQMSPAERLVHEANLALAQERKLAQHDVQLAEQAQAIRILQLQQDAIQRGNEFFTVVAYCKNQNIVCDNRTAQRLGMASSRLSRDYGLPISRTTHEYYGEVNSYYEAVLDKALFLLTGGYRGLDHNLDGLEGI